MVFFFRSVGGGLSQSKPGLISSQGPDSRLTAGKGLCVLAHERGKIMAFYAVVNDEMRQ